MPPSPLVMLYVAAESLAEGAAAHVHVNEINSGLVRRGWQTTLLSPDYDQAAARPGVLRRTMAIAGVNWRAWRSLADVQAIYFRANPLLFPIAYLAHRRGIAVVQECNGPYADISISHPWTRSIIGLFIAMQRWQYRKCDALITVTNELRAWLAHEGVRSDVVVIPNAANVELFAEGTAVAPPVDQPYVVFFGTLAAWQGIGTMLAANKHPEWPKDVRLVIIGDGAERPRVEAAVAAGQSVTYIGRQPYKRIPELIRGALGGLVPIEELSGRPQVNSALKLYETLAVGLPAVVTDYPAQHNLVRSYDCGIVVPPRDAAALARAVGELARDPAKAKAMGTRGQAAVVRDHSWDHRAGDVDKLLRKLVEPQA